MAGTAHRVLSDLYVACAADENLIDDPGEGGEIVFKGKSGGFISLPGGTRTLPESPSGVRLSIYAEELVELLNADGTTIGTLSPGSLTAVESVDGVTWQVAAISAEAFNVAWEDNPNIIHESIHVNRDLGCVPASGASPYDNYSRLANAFLYDSKTTRTIYFDGNMYAIGSKLIGTHRGSLSVIADTGPTQPLAQICYDHAGSVPGAFEFGGPAAGLVWIGDPGETMVELWGPYNIWRGVNVFGQYSASNSNTVQANINYALGAGIGINLRRNPNGTESNLVTPPYYQTPGGGLFADFTIGAISMGFKAGDATYSAGIINADGNHADHCLLSNVKWMWNEDAIELACVNAVHFTINHGYMLQIKRFIRQTSGGHVTCTNPRLQGYNGGATFLHTVRGEDNYRQFRVLGMDVDGTLTGGFYFMNYGAISTYAAGSGADGGPVAGSAFFESPTISQAGYALTQLIIDGGESCVAPGTLSALDSGDGWPVVRMIGGQKITFRNYHGLPRHMLDLAHIDVAGWGGVYTGPLSPTVMFEKCVTESSATDHRPAESVHTNSTGNHYRVSWRDCEMDTGVAIANGDLDTI